MTIEILPSLLMSLESKNLILLCSIIQIIKYPNYSALYFTVARSAEGRPPAGFTVLASPRQCTCCLASAGSCVFFVIVSVTMPRSEFTLAHRIFMYDSYVQIECCREVTRLRDRFPDTRVPHRDTVRKLVNKFRETGSVLDRKLQRTRHVLTEENLDEIGQTLERSPRKSLSSYHRKRVFHNSRILNLHDKRSRLNLNFQRGSYLPLAGERRQERWHRRSREAGWAGDLRLSGRQWNIRHCISGPNSLDKWLPTVCYFLEQYLYMSFDFPGPFFLYREFLCLTLFSFWYFAFWEAGVK